MTVNPLPDVHNIHILYIIYIVSLKIKLENIFNKKLIVLISLLNILINQGEYIIECYNTWVNSLLLF